ncbi:MAG: SycD/LcrH family type III secretion system chaperone [Myxococcaceae bacterium]|nr:SycD/LcrH family type III secretion system chaperone [Myxococcaceae bacterium]
MAADQGDAAQIANLQKWADGKATLKDVRRYSDEELFSISRMAYYFFYQGKLDEARKLFQGLYAVNPLDAYVAKALGVVEHAAGNPQGAMAAFDVALKIAPQDALAYVGRAEVKIALGQRAQAVDDLKRAQQLCRDNADLKAKVSAMLAGLNRR